MTARGAVFLLMAAFGSLGWGQSPTKESFAITTRQVVQTLAHRGIQVADEQVSLVASVVANEPHPQLEILSVEPPFGARGSQQPSDSRSWVKLACHSHGTCLPFYAVVAWPETTLSGVKQVLISSPAIENSKLKPNAVITMRAGVHATLMMDDNRSQIQIPVISLENGIAGRRIHVASLDHKRLYFAEVVSGSVLKGSF